MHQWVSDFPYLVIGLTLVDKLFTKITIKLKKLPRLFGIPFVAINWVQRCLWEPGKLKLF